MIDVVLTHPVEQKMALLGYERDDIHFVDAVWGEGEKEKQMMAINKLKVPFTIEYGETLGFVVCENEKICFSNIAELINEYQNVSCDKVMTGTDDCPSRYEEGMEEVKDEQRKGVIGEGCI